MNRPTSTNTKPSSFSGIWKYPSNRDNKVGNSLDWLAGKRKDDDIGNLWRVHDKLYDLETFAKSHPGGEEWIQLTQGTDITEAFEVSHVLHVKTVENTLAKYYVKDATSQRMSPYTFKPEGFYKTLKSRIEPVLQKVGTGPTVQVRLMQDFLAITYLMLSTLCFLYSGSKLFQILTGLVLTMNVIGAHNFFHLKDNWRKYYFDLSLLSSSEWRISHALSHHLFPNTIMDAEIAMFEPILDFFPTKSKSTFQRFGPILYNHIVYSLIFPIDFLKRWIKIFLGKQPFKIEHGIVILQLFLFTFILGPSFIEGLKIWLTIHLSSSYFLGLCGLNAAHHHPVIFHDGDEARIEPDFGLCQLDAVRDRSDPLIQQSLFVQLIVFGEHSLHHLFPTVCHSKLHHIKPIYFQTLQEFSESFPALSQWEHFKGCLKQLQRTKPNKLAQKSL